MPNLPTFPPLAALFLTHFDDLQGQTTIYYSSILDLPAGLIEHKTLPSGLHTLRSDLVCFTHGEQDLPGAGLFRNVEVESVGRGRRMGTLGVVLAHNRAEDLFSLRPQLEELYDILSASGESPFTSNTTSSVLDEQWKKSGARNVVRMDEAERVKDIVQGRAQLPACHPISFFPALLVVLNPLLVTVYKYALAGKRILIYSPPPLVPLAAFAYCIQAMSLAPPSAPDAAISKWIGNVGLMDLDAVKKRQGGWIGTTSDAIYRTHTTAFDLFIDLSSPSSSSLHPSSLASLSPSSSSSKIDPPSAEGTLHVPSAVRGETTAVTYSFTDIPLYRSLLLLQISPPSVTVSSKLGVRGGMWVWAFELIERAWQLCRGVCEYALGQGNVGDVRLDEGEEDARLIDTDSIVDPADDEEGDGEGDNEAIRVGRLLVRQFHHNTYHLHSRLRSVRRGTGGPLTESELKELCGKSWRWSSVGGTVEGKWWINVARTWGIALD